MMRGEKCVLVGFLLAYLSLQVIAEHDGSTAVAQVIWDSSFPLICNLYWTLMYIAGGIATFVIVFMGVKWISFGDDPGARKQIKDAIIYVIVGLIVVLIAASLISLVITGGVTPC